MKKIEMAQYIIKEFCKSDLKVTGVRFARGLEAIIFLEDGTSQRVNGKLAHDIKNCDSEAEPNQEEYKEYEFCKDIGCAFFENIACTATMYTTCEYLKFTKYLKENNYKILKENKDNENM